MHSENNSLYFRKWSFLALILKKFLHFLKGKLFLYFFTGNLFLYFRKWNTELFRPNHKKQKNIHPEKDSLYFGKWDFLALILKNSYISGNEILHFSFLNQKIKKIRAKKIFYASGNENLEKKFLFSKKKAFLIFWKTETLKKFLIFQGTEAPKELPIFHEVTFRAQEIKSPLLKSFLYFRKWNFSTPSLKRFLYIKKEL